MGSPANEPPKTGYRQGHGDQVSQGPGEEVFPQTGGGLPGGLQAPRRGNIFRVPMELRVPEGIPGPGPRQPGQSFAGSMAEAGTFNDHAKMVRPSQAAERAARRRSILIWRSITISLNTRVYLKTNQMYRIFFPLRFWTIKRPNHDAGSLHPCGSSHEP